MSKNTNIPNIIIDKIIELDDADAGAVFKAVIATMRDEPRDESRFSGFLLGVLSAILAILMPILKRRKRSAEYRARRKARLAQATAAKPATETPVDSPKALKAPKAPKANEEPTADHSGLRQAPAWELKKSMDPCELIRTLGHLPSYDEFFSPEERLLPPSVLERHYRESFGPLIEPQPAPGPRFTEALHPNEPSGLDLFAEERRRAESYPRFNRYGPQLRESERPKPWQPGQPIYVPDRRGLHPRGL